MTKQRSRPSLGQAALMTGLLGVGGWLASSALSSNDANASELPPDPGSYTGTILPDAGSVDLKQLSNSVLDQVAQLRANGHDFGVDVTQQASDQVPAALRRSSDPDGKSRKAWKKAAQQVADAPSSRVLPRSSTPSPTPSAGTPDHRDDGQTGTGSAPRTGIPDGAKERARLGSNNKDSLEPGEIKDAGVESTLFSKEQDISKAVDEVQKDLASGRAPTDAAQLPQAPEAMPETASDSPVAEEPNHADIIGQLRGGVADDTQTYTGTAQPLQGPEALPGTESDSGLVSVSATAAVVWQQLNQRVFDPIKARVETMKELRTQQQAREDVTGRSPLSTDPDSGLDPDSDAAVTEAMVNAGATSANLTDPDAALDEVPVSGLPSPPPMRPFGWQAKQGTPDPEAEARKPILSDGQQVRALVERAANGRTGFVRSAGSIGSKPGGWQSRSAAEDGTDPEQPLTDEQAQAGEDQRDAKLAEEDARPKLTIGDFGNGKGNAEPAPRAPASAAQQEADAEAMAASEAQEQAALNEEGATIKANGVQAQQNEQANVAASQAQNAALKQQEQRTQADEAATQQQAEAGARQAEAEAANGAAAQEQANQAAAFQEQQQEQAAAELSRPAAGSDDADLAGSDEGEDAVPETDSGDSAASEGSDEGAAAPEEDNFPTEGEAPSPDEQFMNNMLGINGGGAGAESEEGGEAVIEG